MYHYHHKREVSFIIVTREGTKLVCPIDPIVLEDLIWHASHRNVGGKVVAIKAIRDLLGIQDLKESKELVEDMMAAVRHRTPNT